MVTFAQHIRQLSARVELPVFTFTKQNKTKQNKTKQNKTKQKKPPENTGLILAANLVV